MSDKIPEKTRIERNLSLKIYFIIKLKMGKFTQKLFRLFLNQDTLITFIL